MDCSQVWNAQVVIVTLVDWNFKVMDTRVRPLIDLIWNKWRALWQISGILLPWATAYSMCYIEIIIPKLLISNSQIWYTKQINKLLEQQYIIFSLATLGILKLCLLFFAVIKNWFRILLSTWPHWITFLLDRRCGSCVAARPFKYECHDDVIKWKHFPRYWPFARGIHRSRWIPRTKASSAELWCFLWSQPE